MPCMRIAKGVVCLTIKWHSFPWRGGAILVEYDALGPLFSWKGNGKNVEYPSNREKAFWIRFSTGHEAWLRTPSGRRWQNRCTLLKEG